jgi:CPA2 family monovalent cation:H+ antiporter-2
LVAHGEFSIVIAGLGAGLNPGLGPLAAAYVLILAVAGPVVARLMKDERPYPRWQGPPSTAGTSVPEGPEKEKTEERSS